MAKAVKDTFVAFQEHLMPLFAATFPPKVTSTFITLTAFDVAQNKCKEEGVSVEKAGSKMLQQYDYTPEREEFLISKTLFYIKRILRDEAQSHTTSPVFLEKLANKIAEMLSFYIMYKHEVPATEKAKNKLRLRVQAEIKTLLFDNNQYIADLNKEHEVKQKLRRKPKSVQKKFKQASQRAKAVAARNISAQINETFAEAQFTPRKRR